MHEVLTKNARSDDLNILKQFLGTFEFQPSFLIDGGTSALIEKFEKKINENLAKFNKKIEDICKYKHQVVTIDNKRKDFCTIVACNNQENKIVKY